MAYSGLGVEINEDRVRAIGEALRELGLGEAYRFEERDPQFKAILDLCRAIGDYPTVAKLTVLNSIVSYMLKGRGEDHWAYFSRYFTRRRPVEICRDFEEYASASPYLARGRDAKLARVSKLCRFIRGSVDLTNLNNLWSLLARALDSDGNSKTIVFAVKMAYYAAKACGVKVELPQNLPIPVDYRVATLTRCSGLVNGDVEYLMRNQRLVQRAWGMVSNLAGIPQLNLDSILWVLGGFLIYSDFNAHEAFRKAVESGIIEKDERYLRLLRELGVRCGGDV